MPQDSPHPEALANFEKAYIPESKMHYALQDASKSRVFRALGYYEEADNWGALRDAILEGLSSYPAVFDKEDQYGTTYEVVIIVSGPVGKNAPVKTYWIREWEAEYPRLITCLLTQGNGGAGRNTETALPELRIVRFQSRRYQFSSKHG